MAMNQKNNNPPADSDRPTSTLDDDSQVDEIDELLVAYLDGELPPEERVVLETRLGRDASLRKRLRTLQHGWDMLDELPMATPSAVLLESTIRMAAMEASQGKSSAAARRASNWLRSKNLWVVLITVLCLGVGVAGARVRERQQFRSQLSQLPTAMHVDAYLNANDVELMRQLMQSPQWRKTVEIAERFGEWDFSLHQKIDEANISQRNQLLQELPIEHQQIVMQSWQRFEKLEPASKSLILETAQRVSDQSDSAELLATMDRFARWRETLAPAQRDQIASGEVEDRVKAINKSLPLTTRQWTQQTSRLLTDEDVETIYQVVRQIARLRIEQLDFTDAPSAALGLKSFGSKDQKMDPRMEAFFLRRMFDPNDPTPPSPPPGDRSQSPATDDPSADQAANPVAKPDGSPNGAGPNGAAPQRRPGPPPTGFDFMAPAFGAIRPLLEQLRGPLHDDELWMIQSVLGDELTEFLNAASGIESLREELLRSWTDETLRRIESNRSGRTVSERYELVEPGRRDILDLLPPDKILESLRYEARRRRP